MGRRQREVEAMVKWDGKKRMSFFFWLIRGKSVIIDKAKLRSALFGYVIQAI